MILTPECFVCEYKFSGNCYQEEELLSCLPRYEKQALDLIMGCSLRKEFLQHLEDNAGTPIDQKWIDIFDEGVMMIGCEKHCYVGIKELLIRYVFFYHMRKLEARPTASGLRSTNHENSHHSHLSTVVLANAWNEFCDQARLLQWFLNKDCVSYPDLCGKHIKGAGII